MGEHIAALSERSAYLEDEIRKLQREVKRLWMDNAILKTLADLGRIVQEMPEGSSLTHCLGSGHWTANLPNSSNNFRQYLMAYEALTKEVDDAS